LKLKEIVDSYMQKVPEVRDYCERCLQIKRWFGSVVLMIVDAAFTSDIDFVRLVEWVARETGYKAIELCWMTWLIQSEAGISRIEKYRETLPKI